MSASSGSVRLLDPSNALVDALGYGTITNGILEGTAAVGGPSANNQSFQRTAHADTNNNSPDFPLATPNPSPGTLSTAVIPEPASVAAVGLAGLFGLVFRRRRSA